MGQRLVDDAVALGQLEQRGDLLVAGVGVEGERHAQILQPDWRVLGNAERAAGVEVGFRADRGVAQHEAHRRGDRVHRHPGAGHQRFEQHVARAGAQAIAARGRVDASGDQRAAGVDAAGHALAQTPFSVQRDQRGIRVVAVAGLDGGLAGAEGVGVHGVVLWVWVGLV